VLHIYVGAFYKIITDAFVFACSAIVLGTTLDAAREACKPQPGAFPTWALRWSPSASSATLLRELHPLAPKITALKRPRISEIMNNYGGKNNTDGHRWSKDVKALNLFICS
jgi:hypothetical protein